MQEQGWDSLTDREIVTLAREEFDAPLKLLSREGWRMWALIGRRSFVNVAPVRYTRYAYELRFIVDNVYRARHRFGRAIDPYIL